MKPQLTDEQFIEDYKLMGPTKLSKFLGISIRNTQKRRQRIEIKYLIKISPPEAEKSKPYSVNYEVRIPYGVDNGTILIGSDAHYWPGEATPAHKALIKLIHDLKPRAVILNGDVHDGARTSRHPPIGFSRLPTLKDELEAVDIRTEEIRKAAKDADLFWMIGNHDMRFENRLAANAPEFEGVPGFSLKEQFPHWKMGMSMWINDDVVVKHRFKGGVHATHNNTLTSGRSIVTGHLHSLKVTPYSDYNGTRYGIDTGTLSDPYGEHAAYGEDNPLNHRAGFIVLTFHNGELLWPEVCRVISDTSAEFRGQVFDI